MSPFEAARKLLSLEAQHLSLGQQSDLIFQDMDLVPLLIQENYLNHRPIISQSDASRMQVDCHAQSLLVGFPLTLLFEKKTNSQHSDFMQLCSDAMSIRHAAQPDWCEGHIG